VTIQITTSNDMLNPTFTVVRDGANTIELDAAEADDVIAELIAAKKDPWKVRDADRLRKDLIAAVDPVIRDGVEPADGYRRLTGNPVPESAQIVSAVLGVLLRGGQ
jgi:hypothetical protein